MKSMGWAFPLQRQMNEKRKKHIAHQTHRIYLHKLLIHTYTHTQSTQYFPFEPKQFCSWSNKSILHISYGDFNDFLSFSFCFQKLADIFVFVHFIAVATLKSLQYTCVFRMFVPYIYYYCIVIIHILYDCVTWKTNVIFDLLLKFLHLCCNTSYITAIRGAFSTAHSKDSKANQILQRIMHCMFVCEYVFFRICPAKFLSKV